MELLGDKYTDMIGNEIKSLVNDADFKAQSILASHMNALEVISNELLAKETLSADRFEELMQSM